MTGASLAEQFYKQRPNSLPHIGGQNPPMRCDYRQLKQIGLRAVWCSLFSHQHLLFVTNQDAVFLSDSQPSFPPRI